MENASIAVSPIGHIESVFKTKNGTPRQSGLCQYGRAKLRINKNVFNNPEHSLEQVGEFSHVWIIWLFHQNDGDAVKAKVSPPRLKGGKVGVFASRSPHRPNPIGLTLARVEKVVGDTLYLLGVDMITGTPVLDIKPFIQLYDNPSLTELSRDRKEEHSNDAPSPADRPYCTATDMRTAAEHDPKEASVDTQEEAIETKSSVCISDQRTFESGNLSSESKDCDINTSPKTEKGCDQEEQENPVSTAPGWIGAVEDNLAVAFSSRSKQELSQIDTSSLQLLKGPSELESAIRDVLSSDPRSVYRKTRCSDRLYYTSIDNVHVTAWFDPRFDLMEVLAVRLENVIQT